MQLVLQEDRASCGWVLHSVLMVRLPQVADTQHEELTGGMQFEYVYMCVYIFIYIAFDLLECSLQLAASNTKE